MAKRVAAENPMRFEDVGVIGAGQAGGHPDERPADAGPVEGQEDFHPADFDKVETPDEDNRPHLPEGFENWEGFKKANNSARESFGFVIRYPGSVFAASGRYHDAQNLDKVYDVAPDMIVPDGLYLIPTNYLVNEDAGGVRVAPAAPRRVAQPRRDDTKE